MDMAQPYRWMHEWHGGRLYDGPILEHRHQPPITHHGETGEPRGICALEGFLLYDLKLSSVCHMCGGTEDYFYDWDDTHGASWHCRNCCTDLEDYHGPSCDWDWILGQQEDEKVRLKWADGPAGHYWKHGENRCRCHGRLLSDIYPNEPWVWVPERPKG